MSRSFIIARHEEELTWTNDLPEGEIFIYSSGGNRTKKHKSERYRKKTFLVKNKKPLEFLNISSQMSLLTYNSKAHFVHMKENVAKETTKWIQYILDHYPNFNNCNIFLQAYPFDHINLEETIRDTNKEFDYLGGGKHTLDYDHQKRYNITEILQDIYGTNPPELLQWAIGAQFYISGDLLRRNKKEYYEKLRDICYKYPDGSPHCFERCWISFLVNSPTKYRV